MRYTGALIASVVLVGILAVARLLTAILYLPADPVAAAAFSTAVTVTLSLLAAAHAKDGNGRAG